VGIPSQKCGSDASLIVIVGNPLETTEGVSDGEVDECYQDCDTDAMICASVWSCGQ
jgi:hypothetical protein